MQGSWRPNWQRVVHEWCAERDQSGCTARPDSSGPCDTTKYRGMATGARIVDVEVGAADGAVDLDVVISAVDRVTRRTGGTAPDDLSGEAGRR